MEDLTPFLNDCLQYSEAITALKGHYKSTLTLNKNPHYLGKLGECLFAARYGLKVNFEVHTKGDGGNDFLINGWSVAIKTTGYWKSPDLKEFINPSHRSHVYVLATVDLAKARGRLVGYISGKRFFEAPTERYRGLGERHVARESDLTKDWDLLWNYLNNNQPLPLRLISR